jgi:ribosomal subunit interface protein
MQITVVGKNLDVGAAFRSHIEASVGEAVGKYFARPVDATVTVARDAHLYRAHLSARAGRHLLLQSEGEATDPYPAFDRAVERLAKQLRRHKRRIKDHHAPPADEALVPAPSPARSYVLDADAADAHLDTDGDGRPAVVAEMETVIEHLTVGEAVMRLDLGDLPALMFKNRAHGGLNMVYRRPDGHIGWVDPAARG